MRMMTVLTCPTTCHTSGHSKDSHLKLTLQSPQALLLPGALQMNRGVESAKQEAYIIRQAGRCTDDQKRG